KSERTKAPVEGVQISPPRPAFATSCRPGLSPPRNSMERVVNSTCVNSVSLRGRGRGVGPRFSDCRPNRPNRKCSRDPPSRPAPTRAHKGSGSALGRRRSGNYRLTFDIDGEDATNVDFEDYH